jgi:hypothetical protein
VPLVDLLITPSLLLYAFLLKVPLNLKVLELCAIVAPYLLDPKVELISSSNGLDAKINNVLKRSM